MIVIIAFDKDAPIGASDVFLVKIHQIYSLQEHNTDFQFITYDQYVASVVACVFVNIVT